MSWDKEAEQTYRSLRMITNIGKNFLDNEKWDMGSGDEEDGYSGWLTYWPKEYNLRLNWTEYDANDDEKIKLEVDIIVLEEPTTINYLGFKLSGRLKKHLIGFDEISDEQVKVFYYHKIISCLEQLNAQFKQERANYIRREKEKGAREALKKQQLLQLLTNQVLEETAKKH